MKLSVLSVLLVVAAVSAGNHENQAKIHHRYQTENEDALFERKPISHHNSVQRDPEPEADSDGNNQVSAEVSGRDEETDSTFSRKGISEMWKTIMSQMGDGAGDMSNNAQSYMGNFVSQLQTRAQNLFNNMNGRGFSGSRFDGLSDINEQNFASGLFGILQPWWKGENVCTREEEEVDDSEATEDSTETARATNAFRNMFTSMSTNCEDTGRVYKCVMSSQKNGIKTKKTLIYECCHGWKREEDMKGCTKEAKLEKFDAALKSLNLTEFLEVVQTVDLKKVTEELGTRNFTVFAPTNEAMSKLNSEIISVVVLDENDENKFVRDILAGHVTQEWSFSHDWSDEMVIDTVQPGSKIRINFFHYPRRFVTANCVPIVSTDNEARDGVIHVLEKVMQPATQTLWELIGQDTRFSVLASLIDGELQEELLDEQAHFTLLAFTDQVFEKLPEKLRQKVLAKSGCMQNLVRELLLPNTICSGAVQGKEAIVMNTMQHKINASWSRGDEMLYFAGVPVMAADRMATNGVLHVMDGLVLLEHLKDTLAATEKFVPSFASLIETKAAIGLFDADDLRDIYRFQVTIFLPPAVALDVFEAYASPAQLRAALRNHVVGNLVEISAENPEMIVTTEADQELTVNSCLKHSLQTIKLRKVTTTVHRGFSMFSHRAQHIHARIGCARVIQPNIRTCNGIIHLIDRVLEVPSKSVMEILESIPDLSNFTEIVKKADYVEMLSSTENLPRTVLAPNNQALEGVFDGQDMNEQKYKAFVDEHLLIEPTCAWSMGERRSLFGPATTHERVHGVPLRSRHGHDNSVRIGGARITQPDLMATNGIVQEIDGTLHQQRRGHGHHNRGLVGVDNILTGWFGNQNGNRRRTANQNFNLNVDWPF